MSGRGNQSQVRVFDVNVSDMTMDQALDTLAATLAGPAQGHTVYFVNAHTLNLAFRDPQYQAVLGRASWVFGDGTGVRWASQVLHGRKLKDNVNGTDLTPRLFNRCAGQGYKYYLLGATQSVIEQAAQFCQTQFKGWELAGCHHGYLDEKMSAQVVRHINQATPHLLLVGMGNPIQERWLDRYREQLQVPLCMATGGLFTYWSGDLVRAPEWVRRIGSEWVHLLLRQPQKARRYLLGNPHFLLRLAWLKWQGHRSNA